MVSGGSWYSRLLDRRLRLVFSFMARYGPLVRGGFELASYLTVRGRKIGEDSLAVGEEELANDADAQMSVSCVVETAKCDIWLKSNGNGQ